MSHPGDDGSFGSLFDGNALGPGHRAASDWRRMIGHGTGQPVGEIGVVWVEAEARPHRTQEIFDVFRLHLVAAAGVGLPALCIPLRGSLRFELATNPVNDRG
jgi:hypothetical protein